jgi:hypothetical protein
LKNFSPSMSYDKIDIPDDGEKITLAGEDA